MKRKAIYIGIACVLAMSAITGCGQSKEASVTAGGAAQNAKVVTVSVADVKQGSVMPGDKLLGEISPKTTVSITSKLSGTVVSVPVKKGQYVEKGQIIAKLDQTDYLLGVKQAEAAVRTAQAGLAQAQVSVDSAKASLDQAKTAYKIKEAGQTSSEIAKQNVEIAQQNYDRLRSLVAAGAASPSQLDTAEAQLLQAKSTLNQSAQGDVQSKGAITTASAALNQAQVSLNKTSKAAVQQAQVGLEKARTALRDTVITAPASGVLATLAFEEGEVVGIQQEMASIISVNPVIVKINVSESAIPKFKLGMPLDVEIPALKTNVKASVTYTGQQADKQSKMFPVELQIPNADGRLLPGMKVNVLTQNMDSKSGLLVPIEAIMEKDGKKYVYVIEGNRAVKRDISTAEGDSNHVIVVNGLKAGEKVAIKGQAQLRDQAAVKVVQ